MKRLMLCMFGILLAASAGFAQDFGFKTQQFVATDFGQWRAEGTTTIPSGANTISLSPTSNRITVPGGAQFNPFVANNTLLVDVGAVQETVTISATTCSLGATSCTVTGTFSNAHTARYTITSGSYGLQEALNYAKTVIGGGTVIVPPNWLGTTAMITSLSGGATNVRVVDLRAGNAVTYGWNGTAYAAVVSTGAIPTLVFMPGDVSTTDGNRKALTGLSWVIPASTAVNYSFHCELTYNQATAATANVFDITTASNAPTNGTLYGYGTTAASTFGRTVTKAYAATTATTIISRTPGASSTDELVILDGFIEQPSSATSSAVSIGITTTSGGTDVTTVARDGFCRLF